MITLPAYIRSAPKIFYIIGAVDFIKNMYPILHYWIHGYGTPLDYTGSLSFEIFLKVLTAAIYAFGWVGSAMFATLQLAIFDKVNTPDA